MEEENLNNQEDIIETVSNEEVSSGLQGFGDLSLNMKVVIGKIHMPIEKFLKITRGTIIEIGKSKDEEFEVFVNNKIIGNCEISVEDEKILAEVTDIKLKDNYFE